MRTADNDHLPKKFSQFCYSIIAGLSGIVIGTAVGWNSPVTDLMNKGNGDCKDDNDNVRRLVAWNTAGCYCLGTMIGSFLQGTIANMVGYKLAIVVCDLIVLVGWLILLQVDKTPVGSQAIWVGRLVQGFGSGGLGILTPVYISQITDFNIRGRMNIFHHAFVCFGIYYSYAFGKIINYAKLTGVCMIWPVLHLFIAFFLPESPFHLYKFEDCDVVKNTMRKIKGKNYDVDSDYNDLRKYMHRNVTECNSSTTIDVSREKRQVSTLIIGLGLVVFQQTCGVNSLIFYMEGIFNEISLLDYETSVTSQIVPIVVSVIQIVLCLVAVELVEFLGRKRLLIASASGMSLSLSALILYYIYSAKICEDDNERQNNIISVYLIILYMCSYFIGWGPVVMLVYTEIIYFDKWFSSLIYACGQFVMLLLVYTFFTVNGIMDNTYKLWMYIASCIVSIVFVCYCVPETRAQNLNRVQSMLDKRNGRDYKCSRRIDDNK